jgi:hypothetical protein
MNDHLHTIHESKASCLGRDMYKCNSVSNMTFIIYQIQLSILVMQVIVIYFRFVSFTTNLNIRIKIWRNQLKYCPGPFEALQCVYSKWSHLENTNQSHCRTQIEKINKRHISQSVLGPKQFEQVNECQTVKIDL